MRTLIILLLGAAVNVTVAWIIALNAPPWTSGDAPLYWSDDQRTWHVRLEPSRTVRRVLIAPTQVRLEDDHIPPGSRLTDAMLPSHIRQRMHAASSGDPEALTFWHVGWPFAALRCVQYTWRGTAHDRRLRPTGPPEPVAEDAIVVHGIGAAPGRHEHEGGSQRAFLPLRPLPAGVLVNSALYAGLLWLLAAVPRALRRRHRIRLGLCPTCTYPVGAGDVCTECGIDVAARRRRTAR